MEYRKQAKAAMNEKISRMTGSGDAIGVDASDWRPSEPLDADVKTGMRPVSRRQYKRGGKVDVKAEGKVAKKRADRSQRKDGGKAIADAIVNRDLKAANQEREGKKHVGGMKSGGRAKRDLGGGIPGGGSDIIPSGSGTKSMMRQIATNGFKKGGRTAKKHGGGKGMGVAQLPAGQPVPAGAPSVLRPAGGANLGLNLNAPAPVSTNTNPGMGLGAPRPGFLKNGGRAKKAGGGSQSDQMTRLAEAMAAASGGGNAELEQKIAEQMARIRDAGRSRGMSEDAIKGALRAFNDEGGADPFAENEGDNAVTMGAPQVQRQGKTSREDMRSADPYEDRPAVEGMDSPPYANGGGVESDLGTAVGHAIAAYHRSQSRHGRKSGGRVGKAMGGGFGEDMNNPKPKSDGGKKKAGPNINITINTAPKLPPIPMPMGGPPMPPPGPDAGMPPGMAPDMGAPAGGPPPGLGAGPPPPGGGMPPGMPPKPPFKRGGAVKMHAGAGSGEGRLEKAEKYGRNAHAKGGKVGMTAGAGSGEGRLEKIDAYGSKA